MSGPVKVQVRDPDTDELLGEAVINNDYCLVCAGSATLTGTSTHANGTHVLTVKDVQRDSGAS